MKSEKWDNKERKKEERKNHIQKGIKILKSTIH